MSLSFKENKLFIEIFNPKTFWQLVRYGVIGLTSAFSYIFLTRIFTENFGFWKYSSITISYIIAFWISFLLNKFWAFKEKQEHSTKKQLFLYTLLAIFNLIATYIIVYIFSDILGVDYLIMTTICTFLTAAWNFVLYKKIIYK